MRLSDEINRALKTIFNLEQEAAAIESGQAVAEAKALIAAAAADARAKRQAADDLKAAILPKAEEFARAQLGKSDARHIQLPYGRIELRRTPGGLRVADKELAVAWAEVNAPGAIKVERSFLITKLTPEAKAMAVVLAESGDQSPFIVEPDREVCTIKAGAE